MLAGKQLAGSDGAESGVLCPVLDLVQQLPQHPSGPVASEQCVACLVVDTRLRGDAAQPVLDLLSPVPRDDQLLISGDADP
jgi:hypothetical protein